MKYENTATRLKQIMQERHLRQVDILEKCKPFCEVFQVRLGRNDLSQYVNGKVEPGQEKLTILGHALNVSEAWLSGFDVPMERYVNHDIQKEETLKIIQYYNRLNATGRKAAIEQVRLLTLDETYTRPDNLVSRAAEPITLAAAHHDRLDDEGEIEKTNEDLAGLVRPKK